MKVKPLFAALAGLTLAAGCSESPVARTLAPTTASADAADPSLMAGGSALFFNGVDANASTALGTVVTTQIDNLTMSATVRYDGPNANAGGDDHQAIVYNGHGAFSGLGILVMGHGQGSADGTIAFLAGGIVVQPTSMVLPVGEWVTVRLTRTNGDVTMSVGDQTEDLGVIPVNSVGGDFASVERTSVGGDGLSNDPSGAFHGAIKRVSIRSDNHWIEMWRFAGHGTSATGINGTVLDLGTASWIQGNS